MFQQVQQQAPNTRIAVQQPDAHPTGIRQHVYYLR